jgi:hypothetical protein
MKSRLSLSLAVLMCAGLPVATTQAQNNLFNTFYAGVGGGTLNTIGTGAYSWIGGGLYNQIYSNNSGTISGGYSNIIVNGNWATIGGGAQNFASANFATVAGGVGNKATNTNAFVGGGTMNVAGGVFTVVGGGELNIASADRATVGGGYLNTASGNFATVAGGIFNTASGAASFAAGYNAVATNAFAFVWSGTSAGETTSTNSGSFTVRAPGGTRFLSAATGTTNGVILATNGASWGSLSDSNAKTDIEPVDTREVLKKVAALPVTSWHYKHDVNRRYIGPMAQDFHAAFGLGSDDKTITTLDTDGVTLAAIQGLVEELEERDARSALEIRARDVEIAELKAQLRQINERLSKLPPSE